MCWFGTLVMGKRGKTLCEKGEGLKEEKEKEITKESFRKLAFQEIRKEKGDRKGKK